MIEKKKRLIVTFHTTAEAMAVEKACAGAQIEGRLFPTPRVLSADCGIAWCGSLETRSALETLLSDKGIAFEGMHELEV